VKISVGAQRAVPEMEQSKLCSYEGEGDEGEEEKDGIRD